MTSMIELNNVSKTYSGATALHPTSLTMARNQVTALIGPSGCGKSTLLRLIAGLIAPSGGTVSVDGAVLAPENLLALRRRMGYVIQDGGLFPHLTARQNVTLLATHIGQSEAACETIVRELCGLTRFPVDGLDRFPVELSGGQRQRVALMRALMLKPDVLLLDEPMGALDPLVRAGLQTDLKTIFDQRQQTVVLVTHDMAEAGYLADHLVLFSEGQIVQQGRLEDLRDRPAAPFVSQFLSAQRSLVQL